MKKYLKRRTLCPHCGRRHNRVFTAKYFRRLLNQYEATAHLRPATNKQAEPQARRKG